jgi:cytochrome c553
VGVKVEALALEANFYRGADIYQRSCTSCHLPTGSGLNDGTYPQLAGQHSNVIVKQIADIVEGRRDNAIMYRFAKPLEDPQKLADVALYVQLLRIPYFNGKGPGIDLAHGEALYARDCLRCHGALGEGAQTEFYPVVAGQHYEYVLRQLHYIADRRRRNAHPEMVDAVAAYSERDLAAVADYVSRLRWPERAVTLR